MEQEPMLKTYSLVISSLAFYKEAVRENST